MGKSLRGRELGKGICQRKDGYYIARFTIMQEITQNRIFSYFFKMQFYKNQ